MACHVTIKIGDVYSREAYVYDDHLYSWKLCLACDEIANDVYYWCGYPDEGVGPEEYLEWAIENHEFPEAAAYLERIGYEYPED